MSFGILASAHVPFPSGAFSPSDVAGLAAWYDATQIVGLSDGDSVNTWADLSGNGITLTGFNTPVYASSGINGNPAVHFTASQAEYFESPSVDDVNLTGNFLILAAVTSTDAGNVARTFVGKHYTRFELFETSQKISAYVGGVSNSIYAPSGGTTISAGTGYVIGLRRTSTNALSTRVDGSLDATATNSASATGGYKLTIGRRANSGSFYHNGHIGEIVIYDQDVSSTDLAALEAYFTDKWLP